jgi:hypothetical protein
MAEVLTQAVSSPAEAPDPFHGQTPSLSEFQEYRLSGEVPERFKPAEEAESVPAEQQAEGEKPENATDPAPENDQEPPEGIGQKARRRFEKLLAEKKELERRVAQSAKPDTPPAPSAAPTPPPQIPPTRPEPTLNDKNEDGTLKYADYEAFVKELGRWSAEQAFHEIRQRELQQQQTKQVREKVESDRARYGDEFESVIEPTAGAIMGNQAIPLDVKKMMAKSDVLPELLYTVGTDEKTMRELIRLAQNDPDQAKYYIAELASGIRQELAAEEATPEPEERAPEPKKTSAPKPPVPVTGGSSRAFNVSDDSLSPEEWARQRNAQLARRNKA